MIGIKNKGINKRSKEAFKNIGNNYNWNIVNNETDPNIAYNKVMMTFSAANGTAFSENEIQIKTKSLSNPWLTKGPKTTFKREIKLYEKFLKTATKANEETCKNHFEKL